MTKMSPCVPVENGYTPSAKQAPFAANHSRQPPVVIVAVDVYSLPSYRKSNASKAGESYPALPHPKR